MKNARKHQMRQVKDLIQKIFRNFGYEIRKFRKDIGVPLSSDAIHMQHLLLKDIKKPNLTIFDVGANRGQTAFRYRATFPKAEIYCFEPFPDSVVELQQHFIHDEKIHVIPKAVGRENGSATFFVNEYDATNSLFPRPFSARRYYPKFAGPKETIQVEMIDLDDFTKAQGLSTVDILKFDIQGGELNALQGATNLLASASISLIYAEVMFIPHYEQAPLFYEISSFLAKYSYSLFDLSDIIRASNGQLRFADALFVSEAVRAHVIDTYPEEP
jgi:FkbM family methyltransferase